MLKYWVWWDLDQKVIRKVFLNEEHEEHEELGKEHKKLSFWSILDLKKLTFDVFGSFDINQSMLLYLDPKMTNLKV